MLEVKNRILELLINSTLVKDKLIYIYPLCSLKKK